MNALLTPEDSKRVSDAIIDQLKHPKSFHNGGLGELIATSVESGVHDALRHALHAGSTKRLGERMKDPQIMNRFYFSQKQADVYRLMNRSKGRDERRDLLPVNSVTVDGKQLTYTEWSTLGYSTSMWDDKILVAEIEGTPRITCGPELW